MPTDTAADKARAVDEITALMSSTSYERADRQARDAYARFGDDPDVAGLLIRTSIVLALARHSRDASNDSLPDPLPEAVAATGEILERAPGPLADSDALALGRAAHRLVTAGRAPAESGLRAVLDQRRGASRHDALQTIEYLARWWFLEPHLAAVDPDIEPPSQLMSGIARIVRTTRPGSIGRATAFVTGRYLLQSESAVLQEVGSDLIDHAVAMETGRLSPEIEVAAHTSVETRARLRGPSEIVALRAGFLKQKILVPRDAASAGSAQQAFRVLTLDVYALMWAVSCSPDVDGVEQASRALQQSSSVVRQIIESLRSILSDEATTSELESAINEIDAMHYIAIGRRQLALDLLNETSDDCKRDPKSSILQVQLSLMLTVGEFQSVRPIAERLAELSLPSEGDPSRDVEDVARGRLIGLLWLLDLDAARDFLNEVRQRRALQAAELHDMEVLIAIEHVANAADPVAARIDAERTVESTLRALDEEDASERELRAAHEPDELFEDLSLPHIERRARWRMIRRALYLVLIDRPVAARMILKSVQSSREASGDEEFLEVQAHRATDAVIALLGGESESIRDFLKRDDDQFASNEITSCLLETVAAVESGSISIARRRLEELHERRPWDVAIMLALVSVLLISTQRGRESTQRGGTSATAPGRSEAPNAGSTASSINLIRRAEMVLAKLRQCIELEGAGYSRNLDRRTRREVMLNSIVVRVELALSKWSDRKSCGNELDRAEELLDAARPYSRNFDPSPEGSAGADSPALTDTEVDWSADSVCVVDPEFELLSEDVRLLRHHWRKRTPQWWQILLAAVIACGGIPWLFQGGWSIFWTLIATTSLVFAALVAMSPWVRKWSFHGLEFSRDELSVAPSVAAGVEPDALRAILRTELMSSLQSRLWSSMASITTRDVDLPKRTAEVDEAAFEQPSKRGVKAMGTESLRLRGRPNG